MFVQVDDAGLTNIKHTITYYELVSGLKTNWDKSSLSCIATCIGPKLINHIEQVM